MNKELKGSRHHETKSETPGELHFSQKYLRCLGFRLASFTASGSETEEPDEQGRKEGEGGRGKGEGKGKGWDGTGWGWEGKGREGRKADGGETVGNSLGRAPLKKNTKNNDRVDGGGNRGK